MHKICPLIRWSFFTMALGLLGSMPSTAQITKSGSGYLFRIKHAKGVKLTYQMVSETPNPVNSFDPKRLEFPFTMSTVDVKGGVAAVQIDSGPFKQDGKPLDKKNHAEIKVNDRGEVMEGQAGGLAGIALPVKPLRIGESYSASVSTPVGDKTLTVKSTFTFAGFTQRGGKRAAELKVQVAASGLVPATGRGSRYLDVSDGQLLGAVLDQTAKATQHGREMTVKNRMTITRK